MPAIQILVVDDYADSLETVGTALEGAGYVVFVADGGHALAAARQHAPSAIVVDVHLSDVNGIATAQRLKAAPETQTVPVIAYAVRSSSEDSGPFDHVCLTPCSPEVLVDVVGKVLAVTMTAGDPTAEWRSRAVALRERALTLCRAFTRSSMRDRLVDVVVALGERIESLDALPGAKANAVPEDYLAVPEGLISELEAVLRSNGRDADVQ